MQSTVSLLSMYGSLRKIFDYCESNPKVGNDSCDLVLLLSSLLHFSHVWGPKNIISLAFQCNNTDMVQSPSQKFLIWHIVPLDPSKEKEHTVSVCINVRVCVCICLSLCLCFIQQINNHVLGYRYNVIKHMFPTLTGPTVWQNFTIK